MEIVLQGWMKPIDIVSEIIFTFDKNKKEEPCKLVYGDYHYTFMRIGDIDRDYIINNAINAWYKWFNQEINVDLTQYKYIVKLTNNRYKYISKYTNIEATASSKGNQIKFHQDNLWYKVDMRGYEGLAEYLASKVLDCIDIEMDYVKYDVCRFFDIGSSEFNNGCVSKDFMRRYNGCIMLTLYRYLDNKLGKNWEKRTKIDLDMLSNLDKITGIDGYSRYFSKIILFDYLILNEDRHFNNICMMFNDKSNYVQAPLFDNGFGFLADIMDYSIYEPTKRHIKEISLKPFTRNKDTQAKRAVSICGKLTINKEKLDNVLSIDEVPFYQKQYLLRAINVLRLQSIHRDYFDFV